MLECRREMFILCTKMFDTDWSWHEFGNQYHCCKNEVTYDFICLKCVKNLGRISQCKKCNRLFQSRNKLFIHLQSCL